MRASRLLGLLVRLQARGGATAEALAKEFEVSVRTIYRDIDALSAAGVALYTESGRNGGIRLLDGYRTRLTGLTPDEAQTLFLMGRADFANALGLGILGGVASDKLLSALTDRSRADIDYVQSRIHFDSVDWYKEGRTPENLRKITEATLGQAKLKVTYVSWDKESDQTLSPLGLVNKSGTWYLVAIADKIRTYKNENIKRLEILEEPVVRPKDFKLSDYWVNHIAQFEQNLRPHIAMIRATSQGQKWLSEVGAYAQKALLHSEIIDDGFVRLELPYETPRQLARLVASMDGEIIVESPSSVRSEVIHLAKRVLTAHAY